jgi:hypothetical protein
MVLKTQESKTPMDEEGIRQVAEALLQALTQMTDRFGASSDALKKFSDGAKKSSDQFDKDIAGLNKAVQRGKAGYAEQQQLMEQLNEAIEESIETHGDATERNRLMLQKEQVARQAYQKNIQEQAQEFGKSMGEATRTAATQMVTSAGQFVKGLQANNSSTELAAGLMETAVDVASAGAKTVTKGITAAGSAMASSMNPAVAITGALVTGLGAAADAAAEAAAKLVKFGIDIAAKEVDKTVKAFNSMSASGAMFANGMTGMRDAAGAAGLTVEQFSQVVKGSSAQLASSGMTVAEAAQFTGKVLKSGGTNMQQSLLKLGYGFEEQGALVADVMQSMRGATSGPLQATEAQVAEQTQKYAENLRVIAAITGEDAKKRQEEARAAAANIAFQAELAQMTPQQRADIDDAMNNMTSQQRKNFVETVVFGTVINRTGAAMAAQSQGMTDSVNEMANKFRQGTLNGANTLDIQSKHAERMNRELVESGRTMGKAALAGVGGIAADLGEAQGREQAEIKKFTKEGIENAKRAKDAQKKTTDPLTKSVVDAETAAQNLKVALEKTLTPAIEHFAEISVKMLQGVQDMMDEMGLGKKTIKTDQDKQVDQADTAAKEADRKREELEKQQDLNWMGRQLSRNFNIGGDENLDQANKEARDKELRADQAKQAKEIYEQGLKAAMAQEQSRLNREKHGTLGSVIHGNVAMTDEQRKKVEEQYRTSGFEAYSKSRGYAAAGKQAHEVLAPGAAPAGAGKNALSEMGLRTKTGDVQAEGAYISPKLIDLARQIQSSVPGFSYFSGANDQFHQLHSPTSEHTKGLALDFVLGQQPSAEQGRQIVAQLTSLGASKVLDEYNNPSRKATAGHIHVEVPAMARGGITSGLTLAGEAGPEAVVPLPDGKSIPVQQTSSKEVVELMQRQLSAMQEQTELTRRMINEQQRGNRVSRDILTASY